MKYGRNDCYLLKSFLITLKYYSILIKDGGQSMSFTVTKTQQIEGLPIDPQAKYQIKEIHKVCAALGGDLTVTPPAKELEPERQSDYYFATAYCTAKTPKRFDEIRLSGSGRVELIGEDWVTMHEPWEGERPSIVLRLTGEPTLMKKAYLDNRSGSDSIEGDFNVKGLYGYVQRDGRYINMELELV